MTVRAIKPIAITAAMVVASSLFETAPTDYAAGTTYNLGNYASVTGVLGEILIYKSLQNGNIGNTPATSPTFWVYSSSTYVPWVFTSRFTGAYQLGQKVLYASEIYESVAADNAGVLDPVSNPPWSSAGMIQNPVDPILWASATTYALNAIVKITNTLGGGEPYQQIVYKSLQAGNTNNIPQTSPTFWELQLSYPLAWINTVVYIAGNVVYKNDNTLWKSNINDNQSNNPSSNPVPTWVKLGPSNATAFRDGETSTQSIANKEMSLTIFTGVIDTLALVGIQGGVATVTVRDGLSGAVVFEQAQGISGEIVADWWAFLYGDASIPLRKAVFTALPPYINAHVTIKIEGDGDVKLGAIAAGIQADIGLGASYGASIEVKDYSVKVTDEFGKTKFVRRGFKEVLDISVMLDKTSFNRTHNRLINLRSTPWFLIVADDPDLSEALYMYGFYSSYRNVIEYPTATIYSLQFESLVA